MSKSRRVMQRTFLPYCKRLQGICHLYVFFNMLFVKRNQAMCYIMETV